MELRQSQFNPFSLSGKCILITGASSGIGRAIAIACSQMGAAVCLTGRSEERLNNVLLELSSSSHIAISADLALQADISHLVNNLPELDGVVHCAGVGSRILCKTIKAEDINNIFKVNIEGPILLQASLLTQKKIKKSASIVFIASRAANAPSIGNAIYSASKGAVLAYAKCLALELAPRQIRVNSICPAMVWTDLIIQGGITKEELEEVQLKYPLKRFGIPEDIAYLAIYLLSDASSWMTGSDIDLTGGGEGTLI